MVEVGWVVKSDRNWVLSLQFLALFGFPNFPLSLSVCLCGGLLQICFRFRSVTVCYDDVRSIQSWSAVIYMTSCFGMSGMNLVWFDNTQLSWWWWCDNEAFHEACHQCSDFSLSCLLFVSILSLTFFMHFPFASVNYMWLMNENQVNETIARFQCHFRKPDVLLPSCLHHVHRFQGWNNKIPVTWTIYITSWQSLHFQRFFFTEHHLSLIIGNTVFAVFWIESKSMISEYEWNRVSINQNVKTFAISLS